MLEMSSGHTLAVLSQLKGPWWQYLLKTMLCYSVHLTMMENNIALSHGLLTKVKYRYYWLELQLTISIVDISWQPFYWHHTLSDLGSIQSRDTVKYLGYTLFIASLTNRRALKMNIEYVNQFHQCICPRSALNGLLNSPLEKNNADWSLDWF